MCEKKLYSEVRKQVCGHHVRMRGLFLFEVTRATYVPHTYLHTHCSVTVDIIPFCFVYFFLMQSHSDDSLCESQ